MKTLILAVCSLCVLATSASAAPVQVPDAGSTASLLGAAVVGLGWFTRKLRA